MFNMSKNVDNLDNNYIRNNPNLRAPNAVDYVDVNTWIEQFKERQRIKNDVSYFAEKYMWIISLDKGKCIIELYPKQKELVQKMVDNKRVITLASRQSRKNNSIYCIRFMVYYNT